MFFRSCSTCRCIFDVFVGRKVISMSYSSTILKVPLLKCIFDLRYFQFIFSIYLILDRNVFYRAAPILSEIIHVKCLLELPVKYRLALLLSKRLLYKDHLQDGRGVRHGDHLPPHKYIKNTSTCGTTTEHL